MPRYIILIGNEVQYTRTDSADTIEGAKRKQTRAESQGHATLMLDTVTTTTTTDGQLCYAEIDRSGIHTGWRYASVLEALA